MALASAASGEVESASALVVSAGLESELGLGESGAIAARIGTLSTSDKMGVAQ